MTTPRAEVEAHFARWRAALDRHDIEALRPMLSEDARGGNSVFGIVEGRDALMTFIERWPDCVPNEGLWVVIDGARVVHKWREFLPGKAPDGSDYHYDGISEYHYAGADAEGQTHWDFMYGLPDVIALQREHARWKKDGHEATYGAVYPGL